MMRTLFATLLASAAFVAAPAYAQVTDQTDQSEEDWRKSRKKSGTSDIYKKRDPNSTAIGRPGITDIKPITPVERLPSESRRHVMRERARAIANSPDGDISDATYEPSEAAKSDEQLARDEQEAWDTIVTDMKGSGGQAKSEGGPNKVAVVGSGGGASPAPGSRGGSTATLQEIMDAIKMGRIGNVGTPSGGAGGAPNGVPGGQGNGMGDVPGGQGTGVGQMPQGQPGGFGSGGQGTGQTPGGEPGGMTQGQGTQGQGTQGQGSDGQGTQGTGAQGQAQTPGAEAGGMSQGQSSGAQGQASSQGQASGSADDLGTGDPSADRQARTERERVQLSPLERMRRAKEEREATGNQRSASDYITDR